MIILALGTNIEPREQYLKDALRKIEASNLKITKLSSIYETPAWGGVCLLYTSPSPRDRSLSRMPSSA